MNFAGRDGGDGYRRNERGILAFLKKITAEERLLLP